MTRRILRRMCLALLIWWANPGTDYSRAQTSASVRTIAAFHLNEFFGVTWPDQPIEFRFDAPRPPVESTRMIGPNGTEVPYQWVSSCSDASAVKGCILVRSELPGNARYTWTLQSGAPPAAIQPINPVKLTQT